MGDITAPKSFRDGAICGIALHSRPYRLTKLPLVGFNAEYLLEVCGSEFFVYVEKIEYFTLLLKSDVQSVVELILNVKVVDILPNLTYLEQGRTTRGDPRTAVINAAIPLNIVTLQFTLCNKMFARFSDSSTGS